MRRYAQLTGVLFALGAVAQLTRVVFAVPLRVADFDVPVWCSGVACVVAAALAIWAFRVAKASPA